jgi:hypothetical protein
MPHRIRPWFLAGITVALSGPVFADSPSPASEDHLAPLARFVGGQWVVDGTWASGEALHARSVYEWGLNKKIITAKTFVKNGDKEYQRYEGVMAWYPAKKNLFEISFAYNGDITEVIVEPVDADTLRICWTDFQPDKPSRVRQTIKFLDKDSFVWTVLLKQGDDWKQLIEATWRRQ